MEIPRRREVYKGLALLILLVVINLSIFHWSGSDGGIAWRRQGSVPSQGAALSVPKYSAQNKTGPDQEQRERKRSSNRKDSTQLAVQFTQVTKQTSTIATTSSRRTTRYFLNKSSRHKSLATQRMESPPHLAEKSEANTSTRSKSRSVVPTESHPVRLADWLMPQLLHVPVKELASTAFQLASASREVRTGGGELPDLVLMSYGNGGFSTLRGQSCSPNSSLVVIVSTAPHHFKRRRAIRSTWGRDIRAHNVSVEFLVGITNSSVQDALVQEHSECGDVIQGNFVDAYRNLTLKTVSMLEWLSGNCLDVKMVLKVDDDVYLHAGNLMAFLAMSKSVTRTFYGRKTHDWRPHRVTESKYYLSKVEFPEEKFPDFVTGPAYLFSRDLVQDLYVNALLTKFVFLEDVFLTGIVASKIGAYRSGVKQFVNDRKLHGCVVNSSISIHKLSVHELYSLSYSVRNGSLKCNKLSNGTNNKPQ